MFLDDAANHGNLGVDSWQLMLVEHYVVVVGTHSAELLLYNIMCGHNVRTNVAELGYLGIYARKMSDAKLLFWPLNYTRQISLSGKILRCIYRESNNINAFWNANILKTMEQKNQEYVLVVIV